MGHWVTPLCGMDHSGCKNASARDASAQMLLQHLSFLLGYLIFIKSIRTPLSGMPSSRPYPNVTETSQQVLKVEGN